MLYSKDAAFCPVFAGMMNISVKIFLFFDMIGLFLHSYLFIFLGIFFHTGLHSHMAGLDTLQHIVFAVAMLSLAGFISVFIRRYRQK